MISRVIFFDDSTHFVYRPLVALVVVVVAAVGSVLQVTRQTATHLAIAARRMATLGVADAAAGLRSSAKALGGVPAHVGPHLHMVDRELLHQLKQSFLFVLFLLFFLDLPALLYDASCNNIYLQST